MRGGPGGVSDRPVGDVYACPFAIHENFLAGNALSPGGFEGVWRDSELFADLRRPQTGGACSSCSFFDSCQGGCMAAKFFTGLPLDGPDPECVRGFGEQALAARSDATLIPKSDVDHSRSIPPQLAQAQGAGAADAVDAPAHRQARPGVRGEIDLIERSLTLPRTSCPENRIRLQIEVGGEPASLG